MTKPDQSKHKTTGWYGPLTPKHADTVIELLLDDGRFHRILKEAMVEAYTSSDLGFDIFRLCEEIELELACSSDESKREQSDEKSYY